MRRATYFTASTDKYSLNAMEVNNSRYDGELKKFAEKLAVHDFYLKHNFFTALDGRRMNDTKFALTLIITMMSGYFTSDVTRTRRI